VNTFVNRYLCFRFAYRSIGRDHVDVLVTDISRFRLQNKASRMLHYVTRQMRFSVVASSRREHC